MRRCGLQRRHCHDSQHRRAAIEGGHYATGLEPGLRPEVSNRISIRRNSAMPLTQPAKSDNTDTLPSDSERLVEQLAGRIGGLGVELADVAGNLQEVAGRVSNQSERFGHLQKTAETMVSANHGIATASRAVQSATSDAVGEITQSRGVV